MFHPLHSDEVEDLENGVSGRKSEAVMYTHFDSRGHKISGLNIYPVYKLGIHCTTHQVCLLPLNCFS